MSYAGSVVGPTSIEQCQADNLTLSITLNAVFDHTNVANVFKVETYSSQSGGSGVQDQLRGYSVSIVALHQKEALVAV
jgi:hypothetical protein